VSITTGLESVRPNETPGQDRVLDLLEGQFVFLEVKDNGAGMTPQTQARMFDPFFTTKFTGRGLGLSAVLGIVRGHAGGVGVESELGKGTKFRVLLPLASGEPEPVPAAGPQPDLHRTGTVLVVDDEEMVRAVAARMLKSLGFSVVVARDGREAVDLVAGAKEPFAAVLMDLTMPNMDGVAAFEELRRLHHQVPVILMSGYGEQDAVQRFAGKGLAGFIQKPFTPEMLGAQLALVLG
jgi:CheY-like chemotaxis protein